MNTSEPSNADSSQGNSANIDCIDALSPTVRREHSEPHSADRRIPPLVARLCIALAVMATLYLAADLSGTSEETNVEAAAAPIDPKALGKRIYTQNCSACHQPTGQGIPRLFPPLAGSEWVIGNAEISDIHLVTIILHGLQGPIEIKGTTYNNAMPPWQQLRDEQIASVLTFIRSEWGNSAPAITTDFVKSTRDQSSGRTSPWSQKDLHAIPAATEPH